MFNPDCHYQPWPVFAFVFVFVNLDPRHLMHSNWSIWSLCQCQGRFAQSTVLSWNCDAIEKEERGRGKRKRKEKEEKERGRGKRLEKEWGRRGVRESERGLSLSLSLSEQKVEQVKCRTNITTHINDYRQQDMLKVHKIWPTGSSHWTPVSGIKGNKNKCRRQSMFEQQEVKLKAFKWLMPGENDRSHSLF